MSQATNQTKVQPNVKNSTTTESTSIELAHVKNFTSATTIESVPISVAMMQVRRPTSSKDKGINTRQSWRG